jgi:hypothetical protein
MVGARELRGGAKRMVAYFCCWEPHLSIDPKKAEDAERFQAIFTERLPPSPKMLAFADFLLARYSDAATDENGDYVWSFRPLKNLISGPAMCCAVIPSKYQDLRMFIRPAARMHGLDFYDTQAFLYIPAETKG